MSLLSGPAVLPRSPSLHPTATRRSQRLSCTGPLTWEMVARAEKRLAPETEVHQEKLKKYEDRVREDQAAGRRGANKRPPVPTQHKSVLVRRRERDW